MKHLAYCRISFIFKFLGSFLTTVANCNAPFQITKTIDFVEQYNKFLTWDIKPDTRRELRSFIFQVKKMLSLRESKCHILLTN